MLFDLLALDLLARPRRSTSSRSRATSWTNVTVRNSNRDWVVRVVRCNTVNAPRATANRKLDGS